MNARILLPVVVILGACTPHLTDGTPAPARATAPKHAASASVPLSSMDPGFLYLAAQNALNEGNPALAARLLQALVQKDPDAVQPRIQLIELLLGHGRLNDAGKHIDALDKRRDLKADDRDTVLLLKARFLAIKRKPDEALASLTPYLARHPDDPDARRLQIQLLLASGRRREAMAAIDAAIKAGDSAELRLMQAQLMLQNSNFAGAKRALKQMRKLAPDDDTAVLMESQIALQQKRPDIAEAKLREFLASHRNAWRVSNALGRLLVRENRVDEAISIYRDLVNRTGGEPEIVKALGLLYLQQRNFKQAEAAFARIEGSSDEATFFHAISLDGLERTDEARKLYEKIGKESPQYPDAQIRLAGIDAREKHLNRATARLADVLRAYPRKGDAYEMLTSIRLQQKRYEELLKESEPALALQQPPAGMLFNRAVAYNALKQHDHEEETLRDLLRMNPNHADALNFLGYSLAERGIRLDEAETLVRRALKLKPNDPYYLDSLAWVYFQQGKYSQAARVQEKATGMVDDDATMLEHLGDIYWRLHRVNDAKAAWRRALNNHPDNPGQLKRKLKQGL